jgi:hypothetical protein
LGGLRRPMNTRDWSDMESISKMAAQFDQIAATIVGAAAMPAIATTTQSA